MFRPEAPAFVPVVVTPPSEPESGPKSARTRRRSRCAAGSPEISQKSKLAEAIRYALNRWTGLTLFLEDGKIEIDSNVVERSIRPLAKRDPFVHPLFKCL